MIDELLQFKSLLQLLDHFKTPEVCKLALAEARWGNNPVCPHCDTKGAYITKRGFRCAKEECRKDFTVTTGSIFENTKIPLRTWYAAMYLVTAHKKGISSHQLARDLNVTQKTAWFLLHRIRETLTQESPDMLGEIVEIDETYVGGKFKNKHISERKKIKNASSLLHKTPVIGLLQRGGRLVTFVVKEAERRTVLPQIICRVEPHSLIVTDSSHIYTPLKNLQYLHGSVNHTEGEYVNGMIHTQGIEGYWGLLKRQIIGIHHFVSSKHLHRYCNESTYRYNSRKITDCQRFATVLTHTSGKRLKYQDLIANA